MRIVFVVAFLTFYVLSFFNPMFLIGYVPLMFIGGLFLGGVEVSMWRRIKAKRNP